MSDLLLQAPPGQINDVYNDLISLTTVDIEGFKTYNLQQLIPIKLENDHLVLGPDCVWNEDLLYYKNSTFKVDHIKLEASVVSQGLPDPDPTRDALEMLIAEYVANFYPTGLSTVYKTDKGWTICIVGNQYSPSNYWAGRWRGLWRVVEGGLSGTLSVQVHYYEDGNVQLNSSQDFSFSNLPKSGTDLAAAIVKHIQTCDTSFQVALGSSFSDSGVATFKNLRRALPITRTKIEWASILSYKVGDELASSGQK